MKVNPAPGQLRTKYLQFQQKFSVTPDLLPDFQDLQNIMICNFICIHAIYMLAISHL